MSEDLKPHWDRLRYLLYDPPPTAEHNETLLSAIEAFPTPARDTAAQIVAEKLGKPQSWTLPDLHADHLTTHLDRFSVIRPWCLAVAWCRLETLQPHLLPLVPSERPGEVLCYSSSVDETRLIEAPEPIYRVLDTFIERDMVEAFEAPHLQPRKITEGPGPYGWGMKGLGQPPGMDLEYESQVWTEHPLMGTSDIEALLGGFVLSIYDKNHHHERRDGTWGMSFYADNDEDKALAAAALSKHPQELASFQRHFYGAVDLGQARLFQGVHPARVVPPPGGGAPLFLERDEVVALIDHERVIMVWRHHDRWYG